jgi:hypothetical protein
MQVLDRNVTFANLNHIYYYFQKGLLNSHKSVWQSPTKHKKFNW